MDPQRLPRNPVDRSIYRFFRWIRRVDHRSCIEDPPPEDPTGDLEQLELKIDIATKELEWRDIESRRLADRAATLLTAASIVVTVGGGLAATDHDAGWEELLWAALVAYGLLAVFTILALRPRPLGGGSTLDLVTSAAEIRTIRVNRLRDLRDHLICLELATSAKAGLVALAGILLAVEVVALTLFLAVNA